ncbi:hypothetical protein O181_021538 [Austropuccinia psidii MF-1]|uniref:Uncharacterized protein n=1 Tax=Austropuccinia psidii MF-1 TaxID=1389203 RepID=A0A9Q3GVI5_9BASI|nr:hypothetical protein [Austropuccinia psidii MF-1]
MSRTTFRGTGEDGEEEEESSVEEEGSDGTEAAPAPVGESEGTRGPTLAQYDQLGSHQTEPFLLGAMTSMLWTIGTLKAFQTSGLHPTSWEILQMTFEGI